MIQIKEDSFLIYPFEYLECVSEQKIIVSLRKKRIIITGKKLTLDYFNATEIVGRGRIEEIQFLKKS